MSCFKAHLFICTKCQYKDSNGSLCSEDTAKKFRKSVKDQARLNFQKDQVRINASGCLDRCENGISAVLYPSAEWFNDLRPGDEEKLISSIAKSLSSPD
ncbi:MAG: putative metal-binding protein [Bacteriovoracaceae bacterium]|jgi:predicted metal-binding protein